jgi:putative Ca2+/H+ antiporter (TMEM165/GDT1 family)
VAHTHEVYLEALVQSFLLVFVGEMGDKTQLLALVLAARFRKPWVVMAGIFTATMINHGISAWAGGLLSSWLSPQSLRWLLAAAFFGFAAWVLIPDKDEGFKERGHWGAFVSTTIAFFLAEMGDKTQLATVALGARFSNVWLVTMGTTIGMLAANYLAVFFGHRLLDRIPMKWVHIFASALFVISGLVVLFGNLTVV